MVCAEQAIEYFIRVNDIPHGNAIHARRYLIRYANEQGFSLPLAEANRDRYERGSIEHFIDFRARLENFKEHLLRLYTPSYIVEVLVARVKEALKTDFNIENLEQELKFDMELLSRVDIWLERFGLKVTASSIFELTNEESTQMLFSAEKLAVAIRQVLAVEAEAALFSKKCTYHVNWEGNTIFLALDNLRESLITTGDDKSYFLHSWLRSQAQPLTRSAYKIKKRFTSAIEEFIFKHGFFSFADLWHLDYLSEDQIQNRIPEEVESFDELDALLAALPRETAEKVLGTFLRVDPSVNLPRLENLILKFPEKEPSAITVVVTNRHEASQKSIVLKGLIDSRIESKMERSGFFEVIVIRDMDRYDELCNANDNVNQIDTEKLLCYLPVIVRNYDDFEMALVECDHDEDFISSNQRRRFLRGLGDKLSHFLDSKENVVRIFARLTTNEITEFLVPMQEKIRAVISNDEDETELVTALGRLHCEKTRAEIIAQVLGFQNIKTIFKTLPDVEKFFNGCVHEVSEYHFVMLSKINSLYLLDMILSRHVAGQSFLERFFNFFKKDGKRMIYPGFMILYPTSILSSLTILSIAAILAILFGFLVIFTHIVNTYAFEAGRKMAEKD